MSESAKRPTSAAAHRYAVVPMRIVSPDRTKVIAEGFSAARGSLVILSTIDVAELPDGSGDVGPQWHLSVSLGKGAKRRATDDECERVLRDFGLEGAEEDNHTPGLARHFWMPVDPARRVECECKTVDVVHVEPDGFRWSNPRDATPENCHACLAVRGGLATSCPLHGADS